MEEDYIRVINITMFGVISWGLIFIILRRIFSNYSFDFSTRIVSALHATVAVILATLTIQDWSSSLSNCFHVNYPADGNDGVFIVLHDLRSHL
ncbi:hypothetical protein F2Q68_00011093 [Brassica cretica]|uniref:TLC domain-containing protein n=1 Tax=Brassica cretica TaxID=69181 RepID=A0A8S9KLS5_BRACR|nr:hypothetical protein F2Q68_00011093 [Brassica cretica]